MQTLANITPGELKKIIKDSVSENLSEKKLKSVFHEVIEEIYLAKAIDEGMDSESINKNAFLKKLKTRTQ
jgi:hypothetical protein